MSTADIESHSSSRLLIVWLIALTAALPLLIPVEMDRYRASQSSLVNYLFRDWSLVTTLLAFLLLVFPLCYWLRAPVFQLPVSVRRALRKSLGFQSKPVAGDEDTRSRPSLVLASALSLVCGVVAFGQSASLGQMVVFEHLDGTTIRAHELPQTLHDEFSYLFQAGTFLRGQLANESHAVHPELFNQMHVLNDDGRFASRYFPGTGLWMTPFLAAGNPYFGWWLAQGLIACFVFWAGRELGGNGVGLTAGLLTAFSPGLLDFSQMLLAHQPTLVGLSFFLWQILRLMRVRSTRAALFSGCGLAFAMLCRPMTAAGFALPFGLWILWYGYNSVRTKIHRFEALRHYFAMALPLVAAFGLLAIYNQATTGHVLTTPYQKYTDIYTPKHVYGFHNVQRGAKQLGPKVIKEYDDWAEDLNTELAIKNIKSRLVASTAWTLSTVSIILSLMLLIGFCLLGRVELAFDKRLWWIVAAIVSLHVVHIPYWFDGIRHYHYVLETIPLWLMVVGLTTVGVWQTSRCFRRPGLCWWWGTFLLGQTLLNLVPISPLTQQSRLSQGTQQVLFGRLTYYRVDQWLEKNVQPTPALVLFSLPPNRHLDFVVNHPALGSEMIRGELPLQSLDLLPTVVKGFPDRSIYVVTTRGSPNEQDLARLGMRLISVMPVPAFNNQVFSLWSY